MKAGSFQGKRFLAGAALAAVFCGVVVYAISAFVSGQEDLEQSLDRLSSYRAIIATRPQVEAEATRLQQSVQSLPGLIPGENASQAAAAIQNEIRTIVAGIGGEVRSSQNLPPSTGDGFEKIEVSCDITLPLNRLPDFLYRLETHTPYLFFDQIEIETPQNLPTAAQGSAQRIDLHGTVRGYRWKS